MPSADVRLSEDFLSRNYSAMYDYGWIFQVTPSPVIGKVGLLSGIRLFGGNLKELENYNILP